MASTDSQSIPDLSPPATRAPLPPPRPAYLATAGSPLTVDKDLYTKIQKTPRKQIEKFTIPIRSGQAWKCPAKSIVRISTPEGPQVGDLNIWNAKGTPSYIFHHPRRNHILNPQTPVNASGTPAASNSTNPTSPPTTASGPASPTCGPW